jgi:hybrid polyketide synthase/nonribosomal peptide synthetase ACE1
MFPNMSVDSFCKVAAPKVTGSLLLDKYFENVELEFFILFSSISCVVGGRGQSNYSAANM